MGFFHIMQIIMPNANFRPPCADIPVRFEDERPLFMGVTEGRSIVP